MRIGEDRAATPLDRLSRDVLRHAALVASVPGSPGLQAVRGALRLEEVLSSTALAGYALDATAGAALLSRGVALGGHRLDVYEAVADYADAVRLVYAVDVRAVRPHTYLRVEEIVDLHRRAMHRTAQAPGSWRERNVAALPSGLVPPPHWLVPREVAAFVDRYAAGPEPDAEPIAWVAGAHARLLRVQPFDGGNGRVARLVANLLLRRLALPGASFTNRRAARYARALATADAGDIGLLAMLTAEALHESVTRLMAAASPDELRPLRALAPPSRHAALTKAAQRGRLRVVRRGTRLLTTQSWLADYEAEHSE
jgi:hypothetical protein